MLVDEGRNLGEMNEDKTIFRKSIPFKSSLGQRI